MDPHLGAEVFSATLRATRVLRGAGDRQGYTSHGHTRGGGQATGPHCLCGDLLLGSAPGHPDLGSVASLECGSLQMSRGHGSLVPSAHLPCRLSPPGVTQATRAPTLSPLLWVPGDESGRNFGETPGLFSFQAGLWETWLPVRDTGQEANEAGFMLLVLVLQRPPTCVLLNY